MLFILKLPNKKPAGIYWYVENWQLFLNCEMSVWFPGNFIVRLSLSCSEFSFPNQNG
jgi:hypothetical protein